MWRKGLAAAGIAVSATVLLAACSSGGNSATGNAGSSPSTGPVSWGQAQSAQAGGGMTALIAAAKAEGTLNVIALPPTWANYGKIISTFQAKYGIKVTSENPDGSSGDEMNAIKSTKGQSSAPDVVDVGNSYALSGAQDGSFAPYKVATWSDVPAELKDSGGLWSADYGGYVSIACNATKIKVCPTTIKALDNPIYKGDVALNGDPTSANSAFESVWATALANGGSASDIQPGVDFFHTLNSHGIFNKTKVTPATIQSGETPIVLDWDYLNVGYVATLKKAGINWTVAVPSDGLVSGPSAYYAQAISINAAHPAAARLWEEFLYSQDANSGQNLWLQGFARPAELTAMQAKGTADKTALAAIPAVNDPKPFNPTSDQVTAAKNVVTQKWAAAVA